MSKLPIKDSRIRVIPSNDLEKFIKAYFYREPNLPEAIEIVCKKKAVKGSWSVSDPSKACPVEFTPAEKSFLREENSKQVEEIDLDVVSTPEEKIYQEDDSKIEVRRDDSPTLLLSDLKWLNDALNRLRTKEDNVPYLHEFMQKCTLILPENEQQKRNAELEARCQKLRKEQEAREYEAMTRNVDNVRTHMPQDTIAFQMKQINRQLIAVAQFIFSVAAGFAFGFIGIELIVGQLDFGFRLLLGIMIALIVALAEIYFLAKKLNEDYEVPPNLHPSLVPDVANAERKVIETIHITDKTTKTSKTSKPHND